MAKLLKDTVIYKIKTEIEVEKFIEDMKNQYDVIGYSVTRKITKDDEYFVVKVNRFFAPEKEV